MEVSGFVFAIANLIWTRLFALAVTHLEMCSSSDRLTFGVDAERLRVSLCSVLECLPAPSGGMGA